MVEVRAVGDVADAIVDGDAASSCAAPRLESEAKEDLNDRRPRTSRSKLVARNGVSDAARPRWWESAVASNQRMTPIRFDGEETDELQPCVDAKQFHALDPDGLARLVSEEERPHRDGLPDVDGDCGRGATAVFTRKRATSSPTREAGIPMDKRHSSPDGQNDGTGEKRPSRHAPAKIRVAVGGNASIPHNTWRVDFEPNRQSTTTHLDSPLRAFTDNVVPPTVTEAAFVNVP